MPFQVYLGKLISSSPWISEMTTFPIMLIPRTLEQARAAQPPTPDPLAPLQLLTNPPPPKKINLGVLLFDFAVSIPLSYLISQLITIPVTTIFPILFTGIVLYFAYKATTYPRRRIEHRRQIELIGESNKDSSRKHQEDKEERERLVADLLTPEKIRNFQLAKVRTKLANTEPHNGEKGSARTGYCEPFFERYLLRYFTNTKIKTGLTVDIPNFRFPYCLDFAYIEESGLSIDIEIDEPYTERDGQLIPIHFLGKREDDNRNNRLTSMGWIVIRFTEEQVARYPNECCKVIAKEIYELTGNRSFLDLTNHFGELQPIQQWREEQAMEMARSGYRNRYTSVCRNGYY